ncbi:MAG TPA: transcription elongation factor GreA [Syntrophaceticus sp.]|nr:transcription elongation factor GreA [Syntrophaceticus sp.]
MPEKEVLLTGDGIKRLEDELQLLKSVKRREIAERIRTAIDFGDISENSEYEEAKNEQAFIEGRIIQLEKMLRYARIIDTSEVPPDTVGVGTTVLLKDQDTGDDIEYTIVGSAEADPADNKISNKSPVGKAILGKKVGTVVEVKVPAGTLRYRIQDIRI